MLPGFFLFMIDRYVRFLQSRRGVRLISARVLPCETVELNVSKCKGLSYAPTSIMFMNVPSISKLQWHPFSISSSSNLESDKLSVIIKGEGSWSKKLYRLLASPSPVDRLHVSIEGPYGPTFTDFLRHDLLVLVSGGSGVTPFISIIRELIYTRKMLKCKTPEVVLISAFKNSTDLTMLDLILPISGAPSELSDLGLKIEAYVTREKQPIMQEQKTIRTVWFKPNPSDAPLTPILATAAFLWNKSRNANENIQIQNMEGTTPVASPNSCYYNADSELESFPRQSLWQSIGVHYGERPDLKRFLSERKESSIGVLVCGPKKLRHEVASICSSGLAANLQFESISFSW
ncbi:UNVERIFIED_CONTAM: Ferric reduction oxidase 2 [Sesamum radiatum]|uniref:ferric-chelate reductase (NADH) n=1 Tax=Sesamum radiatum TaxID=300843 RepID=A0AAW2R296_SESRA